MASVKRQLQIIENAYDTDSLTRSALDGVDDKAIKRILKDALRPWYYVLTEKRSWVFAFLAAGGVWYLSSGEQAHIPFWQRFGWAAGAVGVVMLGYGFTGWLTSDYKSKLGMVWAMYRADEDRIARILKRMDVAEGRVQQVLVHGSKHALLRKVNALMDQLKVSGERIKNIPIEIDKEQKALAEALLGN